MHIEELSTADMAPNAAVGTALWAEISGGLKQLSGMHRTGWVAWPKA